LNNQTQNIILGEINITSLLKAHKLLENALKQINTELERDGAIQRFKFTFELSWKTLKRILTFKGLDVNNHRDVFRESAKQGLIENVEDWFEFIKKRNLTIHTYNEEYAVEIFESLTQFKIEVQKLIETITKL